MRSRSRVSAVCAALVFVFAGDVPDARAEEPSSPPAGDAAEPETKTEPEAKKKVGVEEIIVTATKREVSIQDVPIAMSAFTGSDLEQRGVTELTSLQQISPSLAVYGSNSTTNGGTLRIRGVGTTGNNPGLEGAVGSFIDGVYRSRSGLMFGELVDIERIEVLRGPQGTLFGKNTTAGAVHVITKRPEFEWHGGGEFKVGNFDQTSGNASITGPLVDEKLAFRLSSFWTHRDGYYSDINSGDLFEERDRKGVKGQLLFNVTDSFDFRLIGDWTERKESCCPATYRFLGPTAPAVAALGGTQAVGFGSDSSKVRVGTNPDPYENVSDWGLSGEANWELGIGKLTSITAWRDNRVYRGQDIDFSSADIVRPQGNNQTFENFSEEVRLVGSSGSLDWLLGLYGYTERIRQDEDIRFGTQAEPYIDLVTGGAFSASSFPAGDGVGSDFRQNTSGWSVFTHNTFHITDPLSFTAGIRWSDENKRGKMTNNGAPTNQIVNDADFCDDSPRFVSLQRSFCDNASAEASRREREWTGTFSFGYAFTDDLNSYIGYSRGYKAGGFNLDRQSNELLLSPPNPPGTLKGVFEFDPEFVDQYEVGMKSRFLDDRVTLNLAAFYSKYKGFQLNTFTGLGFFISNVPDMVSQGVEFESAVVLIEGVYLTFGGTYAVARYGKGSDWDRAFTDPHTGALPPPTRDVQGKIITQAPRFQGSGSLNVEQPIPGTSWTWLMNSNVSYRSKHSTGSDLHPLKAERAYWLLNGQLGIRSPDQRWSLVLWGENLTNKRYATIIADTPFQTGSFSAFMGTPRLYGLTARYAY